MFVRLRQMIAHQCLKEGAFHFQGKLCNWTFAIGAFQGKPCFRSCRVICKACTCAQRCWHAMTLPPWSMIATLYNSHTDSLGVRNT